MAWDKDAVEKLRNYAAKVCDGSGVFCEAPMELLESAADEIERLRKLASELSSVCNMPKDFWPSVLYIHGEHNGNSLGYAITKEAFSDGIIDFKKTINLLRMALWQAPTNFPENFVK
jgi:hypothetical protein